MHLKLSIKDLSLHYITPSLAYTALISFYLIFLFTCRSFVVALKSAKLAPVSRSFLELFIRRKVERPGFKSVSAGCHLQKKIPGSRFCSVNTFLEKQSWMCLSPIHTLVPVYFCFSLDLSFVHFSSKCVSSLLVKHAVCTI